MARKKKYPYTDPATGFVHVTPWVTLDFYWDKIVKDIQEENWEEDPDNAEEFEVRYIYLGSIFSISPSGKVYAPFACSNLNPCPFCNGSGKVKSRYKPRVARRAKNRSHRQRRLWVKRYGSGWHNWPAHIIAASAELNRYMERFSTTCPRCAGGGSHEAQDDEDFFEALENKLNEYNLSVMHADENIYAAEYRSVDEDGEDPVP